MIELALLGLARLMSNDKEIHKYTYGTKQQTKVLKPFKMKVSRLLHFGEMLFSFTLGSILVLLESLLHSSILIFPPKLLQLYQHL